MLPCLYMYTCDADHIITISHFRFPVFNLHRSIPLVNWTSRNTMSQTTLSHLSETEISHFLEHGYIKVSRCFSREAAATLISNVWTRLDMSPTDKSTWHTPRTNMPAHHTFSAKEFAPEAWSAICDLLGGEGKIAEGTTTWDDALIVNLGTAENEERQEEGVHLGKDLREWHVDGDLFRHFLDSPEQGLLIIPLFTDIRAGGGGTAICPPAVSEIAKYLVSKHVRLLSLRSVRSCGRTLTS